MTKKPHEGQTFARSVLAYSQGRRFSLRWVVAALKAFLRISEQSRHASERKGVFHRALHERQHSELGIQLQDLLAHRLSILKGLQIAVGGKIDSVPWALAKPVQGGPEESISFKPKRSRNSTSWKLSAVLST